MYMDFDIKNNKYLLSLLTSILGTIIYVVIEYVTSKDEKKTVDYLHSLKVMAIIFCCVIISLSFTNSLKNTKVEGVETNLNATDLNTGSGLHEVNMNQSIHTGNPQF
jgi:hypothetical protein